MKSAHITTNQKNKTHLWLNGFEDWSIHECNLALRGSKGTAGKLALFTHSHKRKKKTFFD